MKVYLVIKRGVFCGYHYVKIKRIYVDLKKAVKLVAEEKSKKRTCYYECIKVQDMKEEKSLNLSRIYIVVSHSWWMAQNYVKFQGAYIHRENAIKDKANIDKQFQSHQNFIQKYKINH